MKRIREVYGYAIVEKWPGVYHIKRGKVLGEVQGEIRGESKKALEIMKRALAKGMPVEDIADLTGVDSRTIQGLKIKEARHA
ncbi:MAG: hypothetical protein LBR93_05385 [Treponema sp.]|nr:hypothetical protein [Treponema sp.]